LFAQDESSCWGTQRSRNLTLLIIATYRGDYFRRFWANAPVCDVPDLYSAATGNGNLRVVGAGLIGVLAAGYIRF